MLSKEQLLNNRKTITVNIDDGEVRLIALNISEYSEFEAARKYFNEDEDVKLCALFLVFCIVDQNNKRILEIEDVDALADNLSATEIQKLFQAAQDINGLSVNEEELAKK